MRRFLIVIVFSAALAAGVPVLGYSAADAQFSITSAGRTVKEESVESGLMSRSMPYRVILPDEYESSEKTGRVFPVLYLLHGLTGSFKDWSDKTKIADLSLGDEFIIVLAEGANGWYVDSPVNANDKFESYIIKELIPDVEKKFRTRKDRTGRAVAGLSMGGYGALKFGIKYPDLFFVAGSFSGALRAPEWKPEDLASFPVAAISIKAAFGPMDSSVRKENDIYALVRGLDENAVKKLPFFYVDCGTEDFLVAQSRDFAQLLLEKKIPHEYRQLPGIHDWKFWNTQVEQFLNVTERFRNEKADGK